MISCGARTANQGDFEMQFGAFFVPVTALFFIAWIVNTWIRAKHGYPLDDRAGGRSPDAVADQVRQALQSRDATIAKLEERVRVLERIVTDEPRRVAREIESLR
jgi:hypothetical protein